MKFRLGSRLFVFLLCAVSAGCGRSSVATRHYTAPTAMPFTMRQATKMTCPDVQLTLPASLHLVPTSRALVPFSPVLLGVEATFSGRGGLFVETLSGGYVDDITEPYDDLHVTGHRSVAGDPSAEVMRGSLQGSPVDLVLWRERKVNRPCDVHALMVQNANAADADMLVRSLR